MSKCDIDKVDQQQQQQEKGAGAGTGGAGGEVEGIAVAGATFTGYVISNFCPLLLLMESCKTLDELFMRNLCHNVASWTLSRLDSTRFNLIASSARKC